MPTPERIELLTPQYGHPLSSPNESLMQCRKASDFEEHTDSQRETAHLGTPDDSTDITASNDTSAMPSEEDNDVPSSPRRFRSLQALYLKPLKRRAEHGVPSCDLQLRSYSVRNLEFFADFALRAAYYLNLPASGPVPLPRIIERWTVPRSNFIFKKSQENFERITMRRLIQIQDGHPESVELWLAFLRKHMYYGIGMKANVWTFEELGEYSRLAFC